MPNPKPARKNTVKRSGGRRRAGTTAPERASLEVALASFAHEIRTPLNGILALAELLSTSDLPERERAWASALKSAAEHLAGLTTVIVDGVRADRHGLSLKHEAFDVPAIARALAQSLGARASVKGLNAAETIPDDLPPRALGDPVRLRAAVENLIDNAVKFTRAGSVSFSVAAAPLEAGRFRLVFEVTDEGQGLSPAEVGRLFRPFSQASRGIGRHFGGAGLGLAFARSVARAMDGDVTVESVPGRGSIFRLAVTLDTAVQDASADAPAAAAGAAIAAGRVLRLLCAEDNPFGRVVLNTIVAALGHRIDFVQSGDAVVEAARRGGYDAVLMDIVLAGADGIAATRRIRALPHPAGAVPIIGISGGGAAEEAAARDAGMNAYLVKPIGPSALARALAAAIAADTAPSTP